MCGRTRAKGSDLILTPLKEAIAELGDTDGLQVHRSWWVARRAVVEPVTSGRNLSLRLSNGLEVAGQPGLGGQAARRRLAGAGFRRGLKSARGARRTSTTRTRAPSSTRASSPRLSFSASSPKASRRQPCSAGGVGVVVGGDLLEVGDGGDQLGGDAGVLGAGLQQHLEQFDDRAGRRRDRRRPSRSILGA